MKQLTFVRLAGALFALLLTFPASAAEKSLGEFRDWNAYSFPEGGKTVCVIWGQPQKAEGKYKKRGDIRVFIAHRVWTKPKRLHEISFKAGYTFKKGSDASVSIDGKKYSLFTDGDTAWNREPKDDAAMVRAMRIGKQLVIQGVSSRGTKTKDTYSLLGFTAAHNAINKACKVK
tara:strand:+ start:682 stop:1203 length:522 start_codon:yes stop_codon:yes gene_type:complete